MVRPENVITGFKPIQLNAPTSQVELLDYFAWLIAAHKCRELSVSDEGEAQAIFEDAKTTVWNFGVNPNFISARQLNAVPVALVDSDGIPNLPDLLSFEEGPKGGDLGRKMQDYKVIAGKVFEKAYEDVQESPTSLIHVTCSGYVSPSAAQELVAKRGWVDTGVTHSYHMGCYGAFPAIKMANGYLANTAANSTKPHDDQIDIVHTEYLSLHGDYSTLDPGSIVNMTLFADGFIKYSVVPKHKLAGRPGFQILSQFETIIPDSAEDMTWVPSGNIFEMYLSKTVPLKIKQNVLAFARELCRRADIDFDQAKNEMLFAIHPGGPKILEHVVAELGISSEQAHWSRDILNDFGNMSSATVPYILAKMLEDIPDSSNVVSMAFGPGLTATGLVLRKVS